MAQAKQDMGSGSVKKLMLQLMIPAVVAQVVNLLYNIVDRIYIGHIAGIGAAARAAHPAPPLRWDRATRSRRRRSSPTALPCCCSSRWC